MVLYSTAKQHWLLLVQHFKTIDKRILTAHSNDLMIYTALKRQKNILSSVAQCICYTYHIVLISIFFETDIFSTNHLHLSPADVYMSYICCLTSKFIIFIGIYNIFLRPNLILTRRKSFPQRRPPKVPLEAVSCPAMPQQGKCLRGA